MKKYDKKYWNTSQLLWSPYPFNFVIRQLMYGTFFVRLDTYRWMKYLIQQKKSNNQPLWGYSPFNFKARQFPHIKFFVSLNESFWSVIVATIGDRRYLTLLEYVNGEGGRGKVYIWNFLWADRWRISLRKFYWKPRHKERCFTASHNKSIKSTHLIGSQSR